MERVEVCGWWWGKRNLMVLQGFPNPTTSEVSFPTYSLVPPLQYQHQLLRVYTCGWGSATGTGAPRGSASSNSSPPYAFLRKLAQSHTVHMVCPELGENCVHRSQNLMHPSSVFSPWCSFPCSFPSLFTFLFAPGVFLILS